MEQRKGTIMLISVYTHESYDAYGRIKYVDPVVSVCHSPREGLDHETMGKLEQEMQELVERRLKEAIEKGKSTLVENTCKDITF